MKAACLSLFVLVHSVWAHGDHGKKDGETVQQYAQRHMASEHHIDSFDLRSFFQLHDLNRDGFWDREEVEAIYGVHHVYSQKKSKDDEEHQKKADHISSTVLNLLDKNRDGRVTPEEFELVGLDGLPNFDDMGAEGHHYDVESEFFLHHEEEFHSTPETQTDESYIHAEDIEHFAHHEDIEKKEAIKEAKYQGISVEEVLASHEPHDSPPPPPPDHSEQSAASTEGDTPAAAEGEGIQTPDELPQHPIVPHPHDEQIIPEPPLEPPSPPDAAGKPKITRGTPPEKQDPNIKFKGAKSEANKKGEWGTGSEGYKPPTNAGDKMRYNTRMQYKFRRNWGDF
ncbi:precursor to secretory protein Ssp120 [Mycena rebaudengoi]|nr:precursor to secretory protein Ssp120 [Mycena rebaudengoi]